MNQLHGDNESQTNMGSLLQFVPTILGLVGTGVGTCRHTGLILQSFSVMKSSIDEVQHTKHKDSILN